MENTQIHHDEVLVKPNPRHVEDGEIHLLGLLIVLANRSRLILIVTAFSSLAALAFAFLIPPRYTSIARILPPAQNQSLTTSVLGQLGPLAGLAQRDFGLKNSSELYVGMLKSRTVEDALIRRFNLLAVYRAPRMSTARKSLETNSEISAEKDGMISISVEDRNASRAAAVSNGYVEELRSLTKSLAITEASQRRYFFEQQLQNAKEQLVTAEQQLQKTEHSTGVIQLDSQAKAIIGSVVSLRAQIAAKEVQLQAMRSYATEKNPDVIMVQQEIGALQNQLTSLESRSAGDGDIQVPTGKVPEAALAYIRRLRDVKYWEAILEMLQKQYEAARLDEARNAAIIQVVDPAVEADYKTSPRRLVIVILGTLLGLLAAISYVVTAEALRRMGQDPVIEHYCGKLRVRWLLRP